MNKITYVNAYAVTRRYGGSEEGGWWFNCGEPLASVPLVNPTKEEVKAEGARLKTVFADQAQGDIYSVLGGVAVEIRTQSEPASYWPEERPTYC